MEKIRVGVVGVGYFGQFHAEKYAKVEDVELVGVVDADASRAKEIAKRCRTQPYLHYTDLLRKVQAVSIVVPTPFHYSVTRDFFLHGVDVLLEKPVSNLLEEADELIGLAESKGLIFQIGHLERFNGALSTAEGKVQHPWFIESHRLGPFSGRGADVDVVLDLMIHDLDILLSLVNSTVKQFQAVGFPVLTRTSDIANARIEFENGCVASVTANRVSDEKVRKTRVFQPGGIISIDYLLQKLSFSKRVVSSEENEMAEMVTEEIPVKKMDLLEAEIHSFLESVRDRKKPRVSGADGRRALALALQIIEKIGDLNGKGK
ncbi:MAG TPA: Gfo/Idh/MocA family oxidoreductase [Thermodesulfobacteriota bacterium]|nr:Gfo/Idh/MocA family oxidoreductase [Thermodesulfobacteriota bacterium]